VSATTDRIRRLLDQLDAELATSERLATDAAGAIEDVYRDAATRVEADRAALVASGVQQERERVLLAIQLVSQRLRSDGTNATALGTLRRMVEAGE
jgi:cell division septum initiation protein DivIVA